MAQAAWELQAAGCGGHAPQCTARRSGAAPAAAAAPAKLCCMSCLALPPSANHLISPDSIPPHLAGQPRHGLGEHDRKRAGQPGREERAQDVARRLLRATRRGVHGVEPPRQVDDGVIPSGGCYGEGSAGSRRGRSGRIVVGTVGRSCGGMGQSPSRNVGQATYTKRMTLHDGSSAEGRCDGQQRRQNSASAAACSQHHSSSPLQRRVGADGGHHAAAEQAVHRPVQRLRIDGRVVGWR